MKKVGVKKEKINEGIGVMEMMVMEEIWKKKGEERRNVEGGEVRIKDEKVRDKRMVVNDEEIKDKGIIKM